MALRKPALIDEKEVFPGDGGKTTWGKTMLRRRFQYPGRPKPDDFYLWDSARVAAICLPMTTDRNVVVVSIFAQAANAFILQLPGGQPRAGESFGDAARRELQEETGYKAGCVVQLGDKGYFEPFGLTTPFHAVLATDCSKIGEVRRDPTELIQVEIYPWEKWWDMCLNGTIQDAKSVLVTARGLRQVGLI